MPSNAGLVGDRGLARLARRRAQRRCRGSLRAAPCELTSDLRGLASALPEPFAKTADAARPLALSASFDGRAGPRIEGSLGRDVHALLQWRSRAGAAPVERGIVVFGGGGRRVRCRRIRASGSPAGSTSASLTRLLDLKWDGPRGRPIQEWLGGADLAVGRFEARRLRIRERERPPAAGQSRLGRHA